MIGPAVPVSHTQGDCLQPQVKFVPEFEPGAGQKTLYEVLQTGLRLLAHDPAYHPAGQTSIFTMLLC